MEKISTAAGLKEAIKRLEAEKEVQGQLLNRQFYNTLETLKPINLLKGMVQDISTTPILTQNIIGTASGMATSFLFRRLMPGSTAGLLSRLFGTAIHYGVTRATAPSGILQSMGNRIKNLFSRRKENGGHELS